MKGRIAIVRSICLAAVMAGCVLGMGCVHKAPRYHDDYYNDWHKWNDKEMDYYARWCKETHHDPNIDFGRLPPSEQEEFFKWRHDQDKAHYKTPH